jgi:thioredoxin reductase
VEITPTDVVIEREAASGTPGAEPGAAPRIRERIPAEAVFLLTGYHPDVALMTAAGVRCDPVTLAPVLHPETFETNVPNLFLAGGASAGRETGSIFIENGRFHGQKIVGVLAERLKQEV